MARQRACVGAKVIFVVIRCTAAPSTQGMRPDIAFLPRASRPCSSAYSKRFVNVRVPVVRWRSTPIPLTPAPGVPVPPVPGPPIPVWPISGGRFACVRVDPLRVMSPLAQPASTAAMLTMSITALIISPFASRPPTTSGQIRQSQEPHIKVLETLWLARRGRLIVSCETAIGI